MSFTKKKKKFRLMSAILITNYESTGLIDFIIKIVFKYNNEILVK